jgi:hypothetical protein
MLHRDNASARRRHPRCLHQRNFERIADNLFDNYILIRSEKEIDDNGSMPLL